jgi:hypothetical protein
MTRHRVSSTRSRWVSDAQFGSIQAGLRVVGDWAAADDDPEGALDRALRREPDGDVVGVGLATVSRLLAIELAAATGSTEADVLERLAERVSRLQYAATR